MKSKLIIIVLLLAAFAWDLSFGQKAVYHQVQDLIQQGRSFREVKVFNFATADVHNRDLKIGGLAKGAVLNINQDAIHQLKSTDNDYIQFELPVSDRQNLKIDLVRHQIFTQDFTVRLSDGSTLNYTGGLYYKGVVEGMPNSVVAISIFDDEVMGMIATDEGNFVLGPIDNNREKQHILYNDQDLDRKSDFICGTPDNGVGYTEDELAPHAQTRDNGDCVRLYLEIDDDIVTQKGGATPATNYITGLFNQSIVLYTNESVNVMINEIYAWVTVSPYTGSSSSAMLTSFQNLTGEFNGNVAMLVSYQTSGGIAMLDGLCQSNPDWRKSFSAITSSYSNVPTYSWSVMVVTHEAGHVIGSKHTHACAWNGNNTAIDGCSGASEGSCPLGPIPAGGGTIMSYCHLQNVGINFNLGFGPQPGNVIRSKVNATNNCLTSCGPPPPPPPPSYCSSAGTNSSYEWINKVVLGSINNTSGNNGGYHDYTSLSTNLTAGSTYSINLTPGFAGGTYLEYWRVWIDYNNDLDWADAGEQVGQGSGTTALNVTFTVPSNTPAGTKRMRVAMKYSGYPALCETFTYGEVEDYNVAITAGGGGGASCSDGIQNQGETGVDCGGPCQPCPTCSDGIQNQGETGIDCGGPCQPCPPPSGGSVVLLASYFETGWDSWLDGGVDVNRVTSTYSYEGTHSIQLRDNSGILSAMTSPTFSMAGGTGATIQFYFKTTSMEAGEDFWVRYNNGGGWNTIGYFVAGGNFQNNIFYVTTVTVPGFVPTNGTFRIQCDASDDTDQVYIDQVTITKLTGSALPASLVDIHEIGKVDGGSSVTADGADLGSSLSVFPNPANDVLNIDFKGEINDLHIISLQGQDMRVRSITNDHKQIDINSLAPGIYFLNIQSGGQWYPIRFSKM
jgi:hypothetical protein